MALIRATLLIFILCVPARAGFHAAFSALSWQDQLSLTSPTSETTPLTSSALGLSLSAGYQHPLGEAVLGDVSLGAFLAQSDAGLSGSTPSSLLYSARNISTYGGIFSLGALFSFSDQAVLVGPIVFILAKETAWPSPGGGFQLEKDPSLAGGLALDVRMKRGSIFINPKVGFLSSLSRFFWSLGIGISA